MSKRVKENPDKVKSRACIVEHTFGTIKRTMNQGYFLTRGLENVTGEMRITILAYIIKRVLNILSVEKLVQSMGMTINDKILSTICSFIMNLSRILRQIIGENPNHIDHIPLQRQNIKLRLTDG